MREIKLSGRESDVLAGLIRALSNKAISEELGISEDTVRVYLRGAFHKLGVRTRLEAALLVVRMALLEPCPKCGHVDGGQQFNNGGGQQ